MMRRSGGIPQMSGRMRAPARGAREARRRRQLEPAARPDPPDRQRGGPALGPEGPRDPEDARHRAGAHGAPALPGAAAPSSSDFPEGLHPKLRDDARGAAAYEGLYTHQREVYEHVGRGPRRRRRHADGLGQDALLQPARPRPHPEGPGRAGALPLPDEGARPGPARGAARHDRGARGRHRDLHLRRRHAAGRAQGDPRARARRGHEPRHAPQGHPAAPHEVGEAVREPALRRDRRAAQPARGVRLARRQHPPAAAAAVRVLRLAARSSSAPRPRSATRRSWPRRSPSAR